MFSAWCSLYPVASPPRMSETSVALPENCVETLPDRQRSDTNVVHDSRIANSVQKISRYQILLAYRFFLPPSSLLYCFHKTLHMCNTSERRPIQHRNARERGWGHQHFSCCTVHICSFLSRYARVWEPQPGRTGSLVWKEPNPAHSFDSSQQLLLD